MNKTINSYTAGYVDGDGCIYIGKFKQKKIDVYEISLQIVSVKKDVLIIFEETYGGYIREKPFKPKHRDAFCWTIKGTDALKVLKNIRPFLVDKINQCTIAMEFGSLIKANNFRTVTSEIINQRNDLIFKIRKSRHMENMVTREAIESLKDKKHTVTPSDIDYPYLAGLIDSEGCFRIKKWKPKNKPNHVYNITVEIGNTKLPIMPWLIERFGGSVCFIEERKNKKASATWTLSAAALYEILPKIRPYLVSKQEVCDKLIEFQKTILSNGGDRHSALFKALFEKRREIRERIIQEVHEFNRKGSHNSSSL